MTTDTKPPAWTPTDATSVDWFVQITNLISYATRDQSAT